VILAHAHDIQASEFDKALGETLEFKVVELEPGEELELVGPDVPSVAPLLVR
jgi:hypothetical protein